MMFNFDRLLKVLHRHKSISEHYAQDIIELWERVSRVAMLCWADNTKEAIERGLNSVGSKEIDFLMDSVWHMGTIEDCCEGENENENYYSPFGGNILIIELIYLLLNINPLPTPTKIF